MLPLLPGFSFNSSIGKTKFFKPQTLSFTNGVRNCELEKEKPHFPQSLTITRKHLQGYLPLDAEDKILTFDAYYQEKIGDVPTDVTRIRKCKLLYYLQDDTMRLYERGLRNDGIYRGFKVIRQKFKKPSSESSQNGEYYTLLDLNVGKTLVLNGNYCKLTGCDVFTLNYLEDIGVKVGEREPDIDDLITESRHLEDSLHPTKKEFPKEFKEKKFLENDPLTLRFYCIWDDSKTPYGEKRYFTLYVKLGDGTFKIVEQREINSGRYDTYVFLRPMRLPKRTPPLGPIGEMREIALLNLASKEVNILINDKYYTLKDPNSYIRDRNPMVEPDEEYYTEEDLDLGMKLNVFGREFLLFDCDDFTKKYYLHKYNKELVPIPGHDGPPLVKTERVIYPPETFGDPEQTIRNCVSLTPRPLPGDVLRCFNRRKDFPDCNDRFRFIARPITTDPVDRTLLYTVQFYLSDETLKFGLTDEMKRQSKGVSYSEFLKRMRVAKPSSSSKNKTSVYYSTDDMYVGNVLYYRGIPYQLEEADDYTYKYMEEHCDQYKHSNIKYIMEKFKIWLSTKCESLKSIFEAKDPEKLGSIPYNDFRSIIRSEIPEDLVEHEMKTLARYYAKTVKIDFNKDQLISMVQTELRKKQFDDFERLEIFFMLNDKKKTKHFPDQQLYFILKSYPMPLNRDLIKCYIDKFTHNDGMVYYPDILKTIDYLKYPVKQQAPISHILMQEWNLIDQKSLENIQYNVFLNDVAYGLQSLQFKH